TGEIAPGARDFVQLRLETFVAAVPGERFILRSYSPQVTIAGGRILDAQAVRHRRKDAREVRRVLQNLIEAESAGDRARRLKIYLETAGESGAGFADLRARTGWRNAVLRKSLAENTEKKSIVEAAENFFVARAPFENLKAKTLSEIEAHHRREPLAPGIGRETLREKIFARLSAEIFKATLAALEREGKIAAEKDLVRAAAHNLELSAEEKILRERLEKIYREARFEVPALEAALDEATRGTKLDRRQARKVFQLLLNAGEIVKVTEDFYFRRDALDALIDKLKNYAAQTSDRLIDVAKFKEIAGVSRKYAIPLLEYFDREKRTRRAGDKRLIL
ncbi:MAG TPA: SelB C-terminal domain-containing protein, partial [Pyrinomonadaceae bacterium]|nr:SelB C-terminal domain-containing protein [Pyrinomonadaceae bacterium]